MTHNELLTTIAIDGGSQKLKDALLAAVELHTLKIDHYGEEVCGYCSEITFYSEMEEESYLYPCPTIKAIEKGLE